MNKSEVEKAKDNLVEASLNFADAKSSNRVDMGGTEKTFWEGYQIAKKAFWDAVEGYQIAKRDYIDYQQKRIKGEK